MLFFWKGNDFLFFPKLLPLKRKHFSHSFSLISVRNTALKREQNKTRFQEGVHKKRDSEVHLLSFNGDIVWQLMITEGNNQKSRAE